MIKIYKQRRNMNKLLKTILTYIIIIVVTVFQYIVVNIVLDGMNDIQYWVAMLFDFISVIHLF